MTEVHKLITDFITNEKFKYNEEVKKFAEESNKRWEKFQQEYRDKALADEAKDKMSTIRFKLNDVEDTFKKGHSWWDASLQKLQEVKPLFESFDANKEYNGLAGVGEFKRDFRRRVDAFEDNYQRTAFAYEVTTTVQNIKIRLNAAESTFSTGRSRDSTFYDVELLTFCRMGRCSSKTI
jgi:hypothetical protein